MQKAQTAAPYIVKGVGGFYYVKTAEGLAECRARGLFRKKGIVPVAGDLVRLAQEGGSRVIAEILPRKNVFVRPPIANLDLLFLVASTTQPAPSTLILDKLSAVAVDKGVLPVLVCTKADLAAPGGLQKAYALCGLPFVTVDYATGQGLEELKGLTQ